MKAWQKIMAFLTVLALCVGTINIPVSASSETHDELKVMSTTDSRINYDTLEYEGHTYKFYNNSMTWEEAKEFCERQEGHLVTISSDGEQSFLKENCTGEKNLYWLGLQKVSDDWGWITGEELAYTNWAEGEPNKDFNDTEYCAQMYGKNYNGYQLGEWNDSRNDSGTVDFYELENVGLICEWDYERGISIRVFTGWDEETQLASFENSISYHVNENTDYAFLDSLDELLGKKVLVVEDKSEIGLLRGIYSVEEIVGKISEWSSSSITLNGIEYPVAQDYSFGGLLPPPDTTSICYLHNGIVVGVISGEEKTGTLDEWDGTRNEVTIDGTVYPVETEDLSYLQSIHSWIGQTVHYVLLDGIVIEISLPEYNTTYTGKLESYDEQSGVLNFSDGECYSVSEELDEVAKDYIGKWGVYTINTSQSGGIHITDIEPVKTELNVTLTISKTDIYYKDGKFGFDEENFEGRSDFEIPYTLSVVSKTNANKNVISQLKDEEEYDFTVEDLEIEIPSGFNFGWIFNEGDIQSIDKGTVIHAGDMIGAEGFIRPALGYSPEELSNTYTIKGILKTISEEYSSEATFTVTENYSDASEVKLKTAAAQALDDISDNIAMEGMGEFFDKDTRTALGKTLLSISLMAKADKEDLKEALSEKLFNKVFGDWKLDTGATTYDVPVEIVVNTEEFGELIFKFTMHMTSFNLNGSNYGIFGSIDYEIVGGKGLDKVKSKRPDLITRHNVGVISKCDVEVFCNAAYELAERTIQSEFNNVWGNDANTVADIIFGQTIKDIMKLADTSVSEATFKIMTSPAKAYKIKCPVDIYLYNSEGEICASIINNKIEAMSEEIYLEVVGDTKIVTVWDGSYDMKLISNDFGDMDVTITEYSGRNNILRTVDFYDIPLGEGIDYSIEIQTEFLINQYNLIDNEDTKISPDQDRTTLELVSPGEHIHVYGDPTFIWTEGDEKCTAVFTCESCEDKQEKECIVTSETTDPTCTEDGKTICTATVTFNDKEYTDTQEKIIPASGHTYEYMDNGDGTHTKECTAGDDTTTELHTYQEGTCTYCGAEEPKEHIHEYGEPEFIWSEDNATCTAVFTCEDGDDQQRIECEVTSEITDATCTENGKAVYTAEGDFKDRAYIDVKEEEIPASGHAYGTPEFIWSEDCKTCTAAFICESCEDEQKLECEVTSETTDPTCTEDGKTVYTATAAFEDQVYTDTKEETIAAVGHAYEYTDNGDGTHTKMCKVGDDTATEPHTYEDGTCTYCGAEEPEDHTHKYGEPKFTWSDDYSSCTAMFTCMDGDDQQIVECTVTSKDHEDGTVTYTAVAEFNGESYVTEKTIDIQDEPDNKPEGGKPSGGGNENHSGNSADGNKGSSESDAKKTSVSNVKTGDNSDLVLWSLLMVSMVSAGVIVLLIRKKKNDTK